MKYRSKLLNATMQESRGKHKTAAADLLGKVDVSDPVIAGRGSRLALVTSDSVMLQPRRLYWVTKLLFTNCAFSFVHDPTGLIAIQSAI